MNQDYKCYTFKEKLAYNKKMHGITLERLNKTTTYTFKEKLRIIYKPFEASVKLIEKEFVPEEKQKRPRKELALNRYKEYVKIKNDPIYFISAYVKIPEVGGSSRVRLYNKQIELVSLLEEHHYVVICKTRQVGASTVIQAYCAWMMMFFDNVIVGVVSKDGDEATDFVRKTRGIIDDLDEWLKPKFDKNAERSFILNNGSKIYASAVNPKKPDNTLRGKSISFLVIDEAAHVNYIDDAFTGMAPAVTKAQSVAKRKGIPFGTCIISTPNGTVGDGEWYYNKVMKARRGDDIYKYHEMHWKQIPEFRDDPTWYKTQCDLLDNNPRRIAQELDMKFLGSKNSVFEDDVIKLLQDGQQEPLKRIYLNGGELWIFDNYNLNKRYIIGADTATLEGRCHSAICVLDFETLEQVAEYQGDIDPKKFSGLIKSVMDLYRNCFAIVEVNSYGYEVVRELSEDIKYSMRLYKRLIKDKKGRVIDQKYGFETNAKTRPLMLEALISYVSQYPYIIKSARLVLELVGLIDKNGKIKGRSTDDLVLSCAMALYGIKYNLPQFSVTNLEEDDLHAFKNIIKDNDEDDELITIDDIKKIENPEYFNEAVMNLQNYDPFKRFKRLSS